MSGVPPSVIDAIGSTPVVRLDRVTVKAGSALVHYVPGNRRHRLILHSSNVVRREPTLLGLTTVIQQTGDKHG
ncbi:hypothetical protein [Amycolatopsis sp. NPDC051071]|uniref:hypothetical protein n=1 Tax=Amycolatopsis sp. NPDC051071 TaxID=3154637 RepID=UPI003443A561